MQFSDAGRLELDDHVSTYLPTFAGGPAQTVTIRQLLNHTSGYSTVQGNSLHDNSSPSALSLSEYVDSLAEVEPANKPGAVWEYSNTNYQILGAVIESLSGQTYAEYMQQRVFDPLGMTESSVNGENGTARLVTGHSPWFGTVRANADTESSDIHAPAGGITSSAGTG